jgi:hypothetical protein
MSSPSDRSTAWVQAQAGWETWAQGEFRDHPAQAQAAAEAAMRALYQRATTEQAKAAGIAAGTAAARNGGVAGPAGGRQAWATARPTAKQAEQFAKPTPPGKIVGIARNVKETTQFGTLLQILDFDLDRSDGPSVRVQIRGNVINGRIANGDEIVVDRPRHESRFIQTDRVFNRTWNSNVEAPKGGLPGLALTEAKYGKSVARWSRGVTIAVIVWVAAIFLVVAGGFIFASCDSHGGGATAPAWWCEKAKASGMENPPGC